MKHFFLKQLYLKINSLFLIMEIIELQRIFSPKKWVMIYKNSIIFEKLARSNNKE